MLHLERIHVVTAACNVVRWAASLRRGLDHLLARGGAEFLEIGLVQLEEV